jgi:TonB family protein
MTGKKIAVLLLPFLSLLLVPGATLAQEPSQQPSQPAQGPHLFGGVELMANDQLQVVDLLQAGKWKEAKALAHLQLLVAAGYVDQYPGVAATALALDALADAGLGDESPAVCRWNAAQGLDPKLLNADLSSFGAPGQLLQSHPLKASPPDAGQSRQDLPETHMDKGEKMAGESHPPEYLSQPRPEYPPMARQAKQEGKVVIESILEKDGSVSHVRVLEHQPLGLDVSALYAVCGWRFKPATLKGEPVRAYYVLTVNFKIEKGP